MRADLILLCIAYVLSQFFRTFVAVLSDQLQADIGVTTADLARATGLWFLAFALMQIPVGAALDRVGPRLTTSVLLLIGGGGGAALLAAAGTAWHVDLAMVMIGIGCSPVLMAGYFIFAHCYDPVRFTSLAALLVGIGSLGNLLAAYPLTWASAQIGWRPVLAILAALCGLIAVGLWRILRNPQVDHAGARGSLLEVLRIRDLWPLVPLALVHYAPVAGIRGLWIGPYLRDVFGMDADMIGLLTLILGLAMITGTLTYGPLDRILGTRKYVILGGNLIAMLGCYGLAFWPDHSAARSITLLLVVGVSGMTYPLIIAHARSFVPAHLVGRGVTFFNLLGIGGAGVIQYLSARIIPPGSVAGAGAYADIFLMFAVLLSAGLLIFLSARDRL